MAYQGAEESLALASVLIQYELDRRGKTLTIEEHEEWDRKACSLIEGVGIDWKRLETLAVEDLEDFKVQYLAFQTLAYIIRERIPQVESSTVRAFWQELEFEVSEFAKERKLFDFEACIQVINSAVQSLEELLGTTEFLIQSPRRWNFRMDPKENFDIKIEYLSNELRTYKQRFTDGLTQIKQRQSALGNSNFQWPQTPEAIALLLRIGSVYKPYGLFRQIVDPQVTVALISNPDVASVTLRHAMVTAERSLNDLRQKNEAYKATLHRAKSLAVSGNYTQASGLLSSVPATFRPNEQHEVTDVVEKTKQQITQMEAVRSKVEKGDLQKLEWKGIREYCHEIRQTIHNEGAAASDYEREAGRVVTLIEVLIQKHDKVLFLKWILFGSVFIGMLFFAGFYIVPAHQESMTLELRVLSSNESTDWKIYNSNGRFQAQKSDAKSSFNLPRESYYVVFQRGDEAAIERVPSYNFGRQVRSSESHAFSFPSVRLLLSKNEQTDMREGVELYIDGVPVSPSTKICHLAKGIRSFSLRRQDQPDYDLTYLVSRREETVQLVSPWRPISLTASVEDLQVSINNGNKRRLPAKIYLPMGSHYAIVTDLKGDIRDNRKIEVKDREENLAEFGVLSGEVKINVTPFSPDLRLWIDRVSFPISDRLIRLSAGEHRIQILERGILLFETSVEVPVDGRIEKSFNIKRPEPES